MKKTIIYLAVILALSPVAYSQDTLKTKETINLDLMKTPDNPGFVLLGTGPSSIERPEDPAEFAISILNSSSGLTSLPKDYALSFTPCWLFAGKNITYSQFAENKPASNMWQTFTLSLATVSGSGQTSDTAGQQISLGFKTMILRGTVDKEFSDERSEYSRVLSMIGKLRDSQMHRLLDTNTIYINLMNRAPSASDEELPAIQDSLKECREAAGQVADSIIRTNPVFNEKKTRIKEIAAEKFGRNGFKLEFASGAVLDYPTSNTNYCKVTRYGAWLTGGCDKQKVTYLAAIRLLAAPGQLYSDSGQTGIKDNNTIDFGGRVIGNNLGRFALSAEGLARKYLNNKALKTTYRYALTFSYQVYPNIAVTYTAGKDFDAATNSGGNLINTLGLATGFGTNRPF